MNKKSRNIISPILCIVIMITTMTHNKKALRRIANGLLCVAVMVSCLFAMKIDANAFAYITQADSITSVGNDSSGVWDKTAGGGNKTGYIEYRNATIDASKYVIYSNAVIVNENKYDLVMYPFAGTGYARPTTTSSQSNINNVPGFYKAGSSARYAGYHLVITEHGNINQPVTINNLKMGIMDLDTSEYIVLPSNASTTCGKNIELPATNFEINGTVVGLKYAGKTASDSDAQKYEHNAVYATLNFPSSGLTVYYGVDGVPAAFACRLSFENVLSNCYIIEFNANGGTGSVPADIFKYGTSATTVMDNIESAVPTRSGYTFKGWAATSTYNSSNKRIAYTAGGTGATTTQSTWTYQNYCDNVTGGDSSNRVLTLYAQWEPISYDYTIQFNANGGTGSVPSTITKSGTDSSVTMGDISNTVPTREEYVLGAGRLQVHGAVKELPIVQVMVAEQQEMVHQQLKQTAPGRMPHIVRILVGILLIELLRYMHNGNMLHHIHIHWLTMRTVAVKHLPVLQ